MQRRKKKERSRLGFWISPGTSEEEWSKDGLVEAGMAYLLGPYGQGKKDVWIRVILGLGVVPGSFNFIMSSRPARVAGEALSLKTKTMVVSLGWTGIVELRQGIPCLLMPETLVNSPSVGVSSVV